MGLRSRKIRERREHQQEIARRDDHIAQLEREVLPDLFPDEPEKPRRLELVAAPKTTMLWDIDMKTGGLLVTPRTEQEWKRSMLVSSASCVASTNVPNWDHEYRRRYGA